MLLSVAFCVLCMDSVLGMNLFGGKFCWRGNGTLCTCLDALDPAMDCQCERANFNSLLWSVVTVFQVKYTNYFTN